MSIPELKHPIKSKTISVNALVTLATAVAAQFPKLRPFLEPEVISSTYFIVNMILRFVTKSGVSFQAKF